MYFHFALATISDFDYGIMINFPIHYLIFLHTKIEYVMLCYHRL